MFVSFIIPLTELAASPAFAKTPVPEMIVQTPEPTRGIVAAKFVVEEQIVWLAPAKAIEGASSTKTVTVSLLEL